MTFRDAGAWACVKRLMSRLMPSAADAADKQAVINRRLRTHYAEHTTSASR